MIKIKLTRSNTESMSPVCYQEVRDLLKTYEQDLNPVLVKDGREHYEGPNHKVVVCWNDYEVTVKGVGDE